MPEAGRPDEAGKADAEFTDRLQRAKARHGLIPEERAKARGKALGTAFRVGLELITGIAVGSFIGWLLDGLLGTRPWAMILFFLFGASAGLLNVIRANKVGDAADKHSGADAETGAGEEKH